MKSIFPKSMSPSSFPIKISSAATSLIICLRLSGSIPAWAKCSTRLSNSVTWTTRSVTLAGASARNSICTFAISNRNDDLPHDIDKGPTLQWMIANRGETDVKPLFSAAVAHRPADELFDIVADPACLNHLAADPDYAATLRELSDELTAYLHRTGDLRQIAPSAADVWETYPRYSGLKWYRKPRWAVEHPGKDIQIDWVDERRPRKK